MGRKKGLCTEIKDRLIGKLRLYSVFTADKSSEIEATSYHINAETRHATFFIARQVSGILKVAEFFDVKAILLKDDLTEELSPFRSPGQKSLDSPQKPS